LVLHIHGGGFATFLNTDNKLKKIGIIYLLRLADVIICLSTLKADEIKPYLAEEKIVTINNPSLFSTVKSQNRLSNEIIILFSGWIEKEKGVFDLIDAFANVQNEYNNCKLIIAGKGRIEEGKELAERLGLQDKIVFTGWLQQNEMKKALGSADIFCLPSYCEGVPMSIIEAMAYSLPVVTTPVGGIPDLIIPGKTGLFAQPGNKKELAHKISLLIKNQELRSSMGKNAKVFVDEHCSIKRISAKLNLLYEGLFM